MTVHLDAAWRRSCANKRDQPAGAPFGRLTNEEKKETDAALVAAVGILHHVLVIRMLDMLHELRVIQLIDRSH